MDNNQNFEQFLESLKGRGHDELIETVKEGFRTINEGFASKLAGAAAIAGMGLGLGDAKAETPHELSNIKQRENVNKKIPKFSDYEVETLSNSEIKSLVRNSYASVSDSMQTAKDKFNEINKGVDVGVIELDSGLFLAYAAK